MKYVNCQDLYDYCNCYIKKFCIQKSYDVINFSYLWLFSENEKWFTKAAASNR